MASVKWSVFGALLFMVGSCIYLIADQVSRAQVFALLAVAFAVLSLHEK